MPNPISRSAASSKPSGKRPAAESTQRLQSYLSQNGVASRRRVAELIKSGQVRVDGRTVMEPGFRIDPDQSEILFRGKRVNPPRSKHYLAFHKPFNVITTLSDPEGRRCVGDFFKNKHLRLFPIGRLDRNTTGLLFVTDDGHFANRIMHPRYEIQKVYEASTRREITREEIARLKKGIMLDQRPTGSIHITPKGSDGRQWNYQVSLREGRNREIRRVMIKLGVPLVHLCRSMIGSVHLGNLKPGAFRKLTSEEIKSFLSS